MAKKSPATLANQLVQAVLLERSKTLIEAMARRTVHLRDLCTFTSFGQDEASRQAHLEIVAEQNRKIEEAYADLRSIEKDAGGRVGVQALIGKSADSLPLYCAMALLVGTRLHAGLCYEARLVSDIVQIAGPSSDPVSALIIRDGFRPPEGVFLPHCRLRDYEYGLDGATVDCSDVSLAKYLNREPTEVELAYATLGGHGEPRKIFRRG